MKKVIFDNEEIFGKILAKAYRIDGEEKAELVYTMESPEDNDLDKVCKKLVNTSMYREVVMIDGREMTVIPAHELLSILL